MTDVVNVLRSTGCMSWFLTEEKHFLVRPNERGFWQLVERDAAIAANEQGWQIVDLRQILEERDSLLGTISRLRDRAESAESRLRQIKRIAKGGDTR